MTGNIAENIDLNGSPDTSNGALQAVNSGTDVTYTGTINLVTGSSVGGGVGPVDFTISGQIVGSGGLIKYGPNTVTLTNTSNSYSGDTTIDNGVLSVSTLADSGANSPLGSGSSITINGGTLQYTGGNGHFNRTVNIGSNGGTFNQIGSSYLSVWGSINGNGSVTKTGTSQLIFNGTNGYTGNTYVNAGSLKIQTVSALGTTAGKTVVANGCFLVAGNGGAG